MQKIVLAALVCCTLIHADQIELKDGVTAKVTILDTTGCGIKFSRNGNIVDIPKAKLASIIWKSDTIQFDHFVCTPEMANRKSSMVFEEGYNCDKVSAILTKMKTSNSEVRKCVVYYYTEPLYGNEFESCWKETFKVFEKELRSTYDSIRAVDKEAMYKLLKTGGDTNCILIPFQVKFGYADTKGTTGDFDRNDIWTNYYNSSGALVKALVNIKIVDLKYRSLIYDDTSTYRKSVPAFAFFDPRSEDILKTKKDCLENAMLNSINKTREFFSKLFEIQPRMLPVPVHINVWPH
jgi:hypothetical protein